MWIWSGFPEVPVLRDVSIQTLDSLLPPEFDAYVYRGLHPDLASMSNEELVAHYDRHGRAEGRRAHTVRDRNAFAALVPRDARALEIGPFHWPLLSGPNVKYFDVLDRDALVVRAQQIGFPTDHVPAEIHFVSPHGDLGIVDGTFDVVLSSHAIEHQPNLVGHLQAVERLLVPGGAYFVLVPDKNYCFDHFLAESTIAQILHAHHSHRQIHTLQSQIEDVALTTHNDTESHWKGIHGEQSHSLERIRQCVTRYVDHPDQYVDVHAWCFSPASFRRNMALLRELSYTNLRVMRIFPTLRNANEFWAVLGK